MLRQSKELIGRGSRGKNALATIVPVAERREEGNWVPLANLRSLFPPDGTVEVRGVIASSMRDGDWILFSPAPNEKYTASHKVRAAAPRKVARFLDFPEHGSSEARRRLIIQVGLEVATAGDWAVRIGTEEIVRVTLTQCPDHRWRAVGGRDLAALPLRRFDPSLVLAVPEGAEKHLLYDYGSAAQIGRMVNWSSDANYLRAISTAIANNAVPDAFQALEILAKWANGTSGKVSASEGADPGAIIEIVRSEALVACLKADVEALEIARSALLADPAIQDAISSEIAARASAEMPALEAAARAKVETEAELEAKAEFAERQEKVKAAIAELEARELANLEQRWAAKEAEFEAAISHARAEKERDLAKLDEHLRTTADECTQLAGQKSRLSEAVSELTLRETALVSRVEVLARADDGLSRHNVRSFGHPRFEAHAHERRLPLSKIERAVIELNILTALGVETIVKLAVLFAAGEVPLLIGRTAPDLVELATALLAGGRAARLTGDPTIVTVEDIWSRAGGNGPTGIGTAAAWASEIGAPAALGYISEADRSAARFWYPALADCSRRGQLPRNLMLCVGIDDQDSEEAGALTPNALTVHAKALFEDKAGTLAPHIFSKLADEPISLEMHPVVVDEAASALVLMKYGAGLSISASLRLARLHAAACLAFSDDRADRFASEIAATLSGAAKQQDRPDNR